MASVKLTDVKKIYDNNVVAVHDFNLEIKDKEFVVFVGPSGCGKSTTLRMIAGLEDISEGIVEIDGADSKATSAPTGIYNLQGVKLNQLPKQKGVYINNGKKVIIK